ncbi:unnamed protein product [Phytophthora fragariaefolia]|uniref:Unnamed protein product n=1 Tax=Phytophthora fragariaefolia TaxID=1490495 RepID=A0A9W7D8E0_9STRA|nr:unnamed protein product [Phytophthora fragariaefolia]
MTHVKTEGPLHHPPLKAALTRRECKLNKFLETERRQLARRQRRDHDASGPELLRTAGAQSNSRGEEQGAAERWADRGGLGGDDNRDGDDDWNDGRLADDHREGDNDDPSFGDDYQRGHARATGSIIVARDGSRAEAVGLV